MVKDVQKLIELIEGNGYEVRKNGSSAKIYKDEELVVDPYNGQALTLHYTPSDWRWKTTKETQLMRAGVLTPEQLGKRKSAKGAAVAAAANSREKRLEQTVELAGRLETIIAEHLPNAGQARLARALAAYGKINSLGLWKTTNAAQVFLSNALRLEHAPQQRFVDGLAAFLDYIATDPVGRIEELEQKNERRLAEMRPERPEPDAAVNDVEPPRKVIRLLNKGEAISEAPAIRRRIEKLMAVMGDYNGVKSDLSRCAHRFADRQMRGFNWRTEEAAIQGILKWLNDQTGTTSGAQLGANKLSILINFLDYLDEGEIKAKWNDLLGLGFVRRDATPRVRGDVVVETKIVNPFSEDNVRDLLWLEGFVAAAQPNKRAFAIVCGLRSRIEASLNGKLPEDGEDSDA